MYDFCRICFKSDLHEPFVWVWAGWTKVPKHQRCS